MESANLTAPENDGAFTDPVLRCDACQKLLKRSSLHKLGKCRHCGNKRVRNVDVFNEEEYEQMKEWGLDEFLKEFEATDED